MTKQQQTLDYTSRQSELLALCAGLRSHRIDGMSLGRINGVVELLQRLILLSRQLSDPVVVVEAMVGAIGNRITERTSKSERTIRRWINDAKSLGLIEVDYVSHDHGGRAWNRYRIDTLAIRSIVFRPLESSAKKCSEMGRTRADTGGHDDRPWGGHHDRPWGGHHDRPSYGHVVIDHVDKSPVPDPEAVSVADRFGLSKAVGEASGLADFTDRRVPPLPARSLATDGVFAPLESKHVRSPGLIVEWFRRQLSAPSPVTGDTEAHLLLVLGAAVYASTMSADDVRVNRTAIFVSTISRCRWSKVYRYLAAARSQLDEMRGRWPLVGERSEETTIPTSRKANDYEHEVGR